MSQEAIREALQQRLDELEARGRKVTRDLQRPGHPDSEERASQRENDEVLEDLDELGRASIARIRHALARLDAGDYGTCERCGEPIDPARLAAVPDTASCVACADGAG